MSSTRPVISRPDKGCVDITEMSPDVDETWLTDRAGDRSCSEFRLVAVDSSTATGADIVFPHRKSV